jgi:thiol-disulfide isomerase/thioredoxin
VIRKLFFSLGLWLTTFMSLQAQAITAGYWQGQMHYANAIVPFIFKVSLSEVGQELTVTLINGDEQLQIDNVKVKGDSIFIPMHAFDATIKASFTANSMTGQWIKHYKKDSSIPFTGRLARPRFVGQNSKHVAAVKSELNMTFVPEFGSPYPAIGMFEQTGRHITGTVITEVGDFRFFEGIVDGDSLKLSSFDGAHAFLILGKKSGNTWQGTFVFDNGYEELWETHAGDTAILPDPFVEIATEDDADQQPFFDILSAGSGFNQLDASEYDNKVLIIQLLGSWCPNSLDETRFLVEWYAKNKAANVEILAVFFEMNYSQDYGLRRISEYVASNNIPYSTTLGGPANKGQAALAFPFVNKLNAFPTLMILDKTGKVRFMHRYFQGPATGSRYNDFGTRFDKLINDLLAE